MSDAPSTPKQQCETPSHSVPVGANQVWIQPARHLFPTSLFSHAHAGTQSASKHPSNESNELLSTNFTQPRYWPCLLYVFKRWKSCFLLSCAEGVTEMDCSIQPGEPFDGYWKVESNELFVVFSCGRSEACIIAWSVTLTFPLWRDASIPLPE